MATVLTGTNQVKTQDGKIVTAQQGGWYDGQQFWNGTLSAPGVINSQSNQIGAGQAVSSEVNRQSDQAQGLQPGTIDAFLANQRKTVTPAPTPAPRTGTTGLSTMAGTNAGAGTGTGAGFQAPQAVDLVGQFKELLAGSGIKEKEAQLSQMEKDFIEAKGGINDNPFLNEASRVGREAKLTKLFDERTANIRGEIATARADAETQLNLQMKQFDMNSQQAKDAMDQFNFLLSSGALNNASGEDIANITRATGLSSNIIQSAIQSSQKKDVNSQVITSEDNNGNVTVTTINKDTGEILNQSSLGAIGSAKTTGGSSGAKAGSSEYIAESKNKIISYLYDPQIINPYGHVDPSEWNQAMQAWMKDVGSRDEFISNFKNLTDPNRGDFEEQSGYGFPKYLRKE